MGSKEGSLKAWRTRQARYTSEERSTIGRKSWKTRQAHYTPEELNALMQKAWERHPNSRPSGIPPDAYNKFGQHLMRASEHAIPFCFSPEEWWRVWQESGHWHERGNRKHQYCMARINDTGPYAIWNVEIITCAENRIRQRRHSPHTRAKISATLRGASKDGRGGVGASLPL
jgi:hypothetical protein